MDHRATLLSPTGDSRALVVDDHPLFCDALTLTLQSLAGFARIDTAGTLERALELVSDGDPPHLVILDLTLPDVTGLDGLLRLRRAVPRAALLIVSSMADNRMVSHVMKAGADGFVPKHAQRSVFRRAFEAVARGEPFLPDGYIDPQAPGSGSGAAEALERQAAEEKAHLVVWKDLAPAEEEGFGRALKQAGFARLGSLPIALLDLPFKNEAAYLATLSAATRAPGM